jgi:DNA-binding YbaB/EbfC family protein
MADFMKILQQAQEMQGRLQKIQEELQQQTVTASSGGGMVTVEANGQGAVRSIKIDPSVVNPADVEMLEDLLLVAVSEAQKKAQAVQQEAQQAEMSKLTGGLPFKLPF